MYKCVLTHFNTFTFNFSCLVHIFNLLINTKTNNNYEQDIF